MNKKVVVVILVTLAVVAGAYFILNKPSAPPVSIQADNQSPPVAAQNDLPPISVTKLDGTPVSVRNIQGRSILIVFLPDCDHCQREAAQIRDNISAFQNYSLYFISSAPLPELAQFAKDYKLVDYPNVHFAQTTIQDINQSFGYIPTPSLYIYADGGKMVKSFKGETPIELILPTI